MSSKNHADSTVSSNSIWYTTKLKRLNLKPYNAIYYYITLLNNSKQTLRTLELSGAPYHQWGPPSLDAAATPSLRHCFSSSGLNMLNVLNYKFHTDRPISTANAEKKLFSDFIRWLINCMSNARKVPYTVSTHYRLQSWASFSNSEIRDWGFCNPGILPRLRDLSENMEFTAVCRAYSNIGL